MTPTDDCKSKVLCYHDKTAAVHTGLSRFYNHRLFSDLTIISPDNHKIFCHQIVLSSGSRRFAEVLEQGNLQGEELPVRGVDPAGLESVLRFLYTGECSLDYTNVLAVYDAAHRLDVPNLAAACEAFCSEVLSTSTCCKLLQQAIQFTLHDYANQCLAMVRDRFADVTEDDDFVSLNVHTVMRIINDALDSCQEETAVFKAAWRWGLADASHMQHLSEILKVVKVPDMDLQELVKLGAVQRPSAGAAVALNLGCSAGPAAQQVNGLQQVLINQLLAGAGVQGAVQKAAEVAAAAAAAARGTSMFDAPCSGHALQVHTLPTTLPINQSPVPVTPGTNAKGVDTVALLQQAVLSGAVQVVPLGTTDVVAATTATGVLQPTVLQLPPGSINIKSLPSVHASAPGGLPVAAAAGMPTAAVGGPLGALKSEMLPGRATKPIGVMGHVASAPLPRQFITRVPAQVTTLGGIAAGHDMQLVASAELGHNLQAQLQAPNKKHGALQAGSHVIEGTAKTMSAPERSYHERSVDTQRTEMRHGSHNQAFDNNNHTSGITPTSRPAPVRSEPDALAKFSQAVKERHESAYLEPQQVQAAASRPKLSTSTKGMCQVEGCGTDLSGLRDYHVRYKICEYHLKVPSIMRFGVPQRFCQQCGRFHHLDQFDGSKRSCRGRLQKHNARRRRKAEVTNNNATAAVVGYSPKRPRHSGPGEFDPGAPSTSGNNEMVANSDDGSGGYEDGYQVHRHSSFIVREDNGNGDTGIYSVNGWLSSHTISQNGSSGPPADMQEDPAQRFSSMPARHHVHPVPAGRSRHLSYSLNNGFNTATPVVDSSEAAGVRGQHGVGPAGDSHDHALDVLASACIAEHPDFSTSQHRTSSSNGPALEEDTDMVAVAEHRQRHQQLLAQIVAGNALAAWHDDSSLQSLADQANKHKGHSMSAGLPDVGSPDGSEQTLSANHMKEDQND